MVSFQGFGRIQKTIFFRICDFGGAGPGKNPEAAAEVLGLLSTSNVQAKHLQVEKIKIDKLSSDGEDADMDNFEEDNLGLVENSNKTELSPNAWIKEENQEEEDSDNDDDSDNDYVPSKQASSEVKAELKSPKKERIKCKRCPQTFVYLAALKKHVQKHKEEDEDSDVEDSEPEENDQNLALDAKPESKYMCKLGCTGKSGMEFKMKGSLIRHYMNVHSKPHECCGENFSDYKVYRKHLFTAHHNFQCAECAETFYRKDQLERHQKWNHEIGAQKCPMCPAVIKDVEMHMKNCHTGEKLTCSACPYTSRRKADIDGHFKKVHTDLNKETCPVCGETFKGLKRHLERTMCGTGKKAEATIPCPRGCPKMFTLPDSVEKHVKQVHDQIKNKLCPFCEYKTYSNFNLKLHVTKMHEGRKFEKEQCLHCDKATFSLDYHMQIYHQDKM